MGSQRFSKIVSIDYGPNNFVKTDVMALNKISRNGMKSIVVGGKSCKRAGAAIKSCANIEEISLEHFPGDDFFGSLENSNIRRFRLCVNSDDFENREQLHEKVRLMFRNVGELTHFQLINFTYLK